MGAETLAFWIHTTVLFAVSILLGEILSRLILKIAAFMVGKTKTTLDDRIFAAIKTPIESFFFLIIFYLLIHYAPSYISELTDMSAAAKFLEAYTWAFLVVICTYLASQIVGASLHWYYEEGHKGSRLKIDLSLIPFIYKVSAIAIYFVGGTIALGAAGFDVTGLLALTSIAGVIVGFASQETLANVFAGLALQLDRPYHYGDHVRFVSGETAKVKKIGLRSTVLEDASGAAIIISNSELAKQRITNFTHPSGTLTLSFPAEVLLGTDLKKLHAYLARALSSAKPDGYNPSSLKLNVERIKEKTSELSVTYTVTGFPNSAPIRFFINAKIIEFLKGKI